MFKGCNEVHLNWLSVAVGAVVPLRSPLSRVHFNLFAMQGDKINADSLDAGGLRKGQAVHKPIFNPASNSHQGGEQAQPSPDQDVRKLVRFRSSSKVETRQEEKEGFDDEDTAPGPRSVESRLRLHELQGRNENVQENSVLTDIERNGRAGGKGMEDLYEFIEKDDDNRRDQKDANSQPPEVRGRPSMVDATKELTLRARMRKTASTRDPTDYAQFETGFGKRETKGITKRIYKLRKALRFLFPDIGQRINVYLAILFLLFVAYSARNFRSGPQIFTLFGVTALLELACSVIDRCLYKVIDVVFASHFNIAYQLHAFNGPFGGIITVVFVRNYWERFHASALIRHWDTYVTAAAVFVLCWAAKNWLSRRQYVYLLEQRFAEKVESLNTMIIILSELASTRPPKTKTVRRTPTPLTGTSNKKNSPVVQNPAVQGVLKGGQVVFTEGIRAAGKVSYCSIGARGTFVVTGLLRSCV
jgi:hypothetical protein